VLCGDGASCCPCGRLTASPATAQSRSWLNIRIFAGSLPWDSSPIPKGSTTQETYRASLVVRTNRRRGPRAASTAIPYLLGPVEHLAFTASPGIEVWHHQAGGPLALYVLEPFARFRYLLLGSALGEGHLPQAVAEAGCWFAAEPTSPSGWSMVACTAAPGFEFGDLQLPRPKGSPEGAPIPIGSGPASLPTNGTPGTDHAREGKDDRMISSLRSGHDARPPDHGSVRGQEDR